MKYSESKVRLYKGEGTVKILMQTHEEYLNLLLEQCNQEYAIATEARLQGHDPRIEVEIPQAHDLAQRTQQLLEFLHPRNTAEQIRQLTTERDENRELVALDLALKPCCMVKAITVKLAKGLAKLKKENGGSESVMLAVAKELSLSIKTQLKPTLKSKYWPNLKRMINRNGNQSKSLWLFIMVYVQDWPS